MKHKKSISSIPRPAIKKLRWMRLDNAAKLFSATRNQNWSNVFRLSMTLQEEIDMDVMQSALDATVKRFPSIAARLRKGLFWFYLQQLEQAPKIRAEASYPLTRMSYKEARKCALRVIVYRDRVAVEFFHSLTDGNGGMVFLKTLVAEYLHRKYGASIAAEDGVLCLEDEPEEAELEDSFLKYAGPISGKRKEETAWQLSETPEYDGFIHLTCFEMSVSSVREMSRKYGVSVTAFLCAVMMKALQQLQMEQIPKVRSRKAIKVYIPVNLRNLFPSKTLRNFVLYTMPQLDTRMGEYDFADICRVVHHWMGWDISPRRMAAMMAANVSIESSLPVRLIPLFIKNLIMKAAFLINGERKSCLTMSNLGQISVPEGMKPYIAGMDFIMGLKATSPYNCGVVSYGDSLRVNIIRNTREPQLELAYFKVLQELEIAAQVSSNGGIS